MDILITFPLFLLASFASFFIPGFFIIGKLKLKFSETEKHSLSWILGLSIFILATYALSWIGLSYVYLLLIFFLLFYSIFKKDIRDKVIHNLNSIFKEDRIALLIILLGSILMSSVMFFSGLRTDEGMQFFGVNAADGIRHIAYTKVMKHSFPPMHPGFADVELRGFHYFYDFMLAKFSTYFVFLIEDLYFRMFPFLISVMYGLTFYVLGGKFTNSQFQKRLILFFLYFSQGSVVVMLTLGLANSLDGAIVQPLGLIVNPFSILSMALFAQGIILIPDVKKSWKVALVAGVILGILSQMKVYIGLVGIVCVILYSTYLLIRFRKKYLITSLILLATTGFTTMFTFLPNNFGSGGLIFAPFIYYQHYMQTGLLAPFHWEIKRQIFFQDSNYLRIIFLYIQAVIIFFAVNLGARLVILLKVRSLFSKEFYKNDFNPLLLISIITLLILGSFFVQTVSMFDTVQFFWLALVVLAIPSGIVWGDILQKNKVLKTLGVTLLVAISAPIIYHYTATYFPLSRAFVIPERSIEILERLSKPEEGEYIVVLPEKVREREQTTYNYPPVPLVSAVSGYPTYLEGGEIPHQFEDLQKNREYMVNELLKAFEECGEEKIIEISKKINTKQIVSFTPYECIATSSVVRSAKISEEIGLYLLN